MRDGFEPQQRRSREMLDRLLGAAAKVLAEQGLDGAVIPRIAAEADVAPASIYRRFADKDALLRAAFLHVLRLSNNANRTHLAERLVQPSLEETAERLMSMLFAQYQTHARLLRALMRFLETDTDQAFVEEARRMIATNIGEIVEVLLVFRERIDHPDAKRALEIAVLSAASSIEAIALEPRSLWRVVVAASEEEIGRELASGFVAYLVAGRRWWEGAGS